MYPAPALVVGTAEQKLTMTAKADGAETRLKMTARPTGTNWVCSMFACAKVALFGFGGGPGFGNGLGRGLGRGGIYGRITWNSGLLRRDPP